MIGAGRGDPFALPSPVEMRSALEALTETAEAATMLQELVMLGLDKLPLPGSGRTLQRWQMLAVVAQHSLSLAKLYEGHTDALAILAEVNHLVAGSEGATFGMWASEVRNQRVVIQSSSEGRVKLNGTKCWCSGASSVSHGLLTAWYADGRGPQLVAVAMHQPEIAISSDAWTAVGMEQSASVDITFSQADAHLVGSLGEYLHRPGFWQGGAGVAACWYGGAVMLGTTLHEALSALPKEARDPFKLAALGKSDMSLQSTAALLRDAAHWVDAHPAADASSVALRVRLAAEACATTVLDEAGRALGAAAFCRNARFARAAADLPVFVRQSHAERDFAALAERIIPSVERPWSL